MGIVNHRETIGLRKLGNPQAFQFYRWEALSSDACLMTGCVVTRTYTKGPRKGKPVYDGAPQKAVITESEEQAERVRYEAETGVCGECGGDGQEWAGWDHVEGTKWRQCRRCKGSGKPPSVDARFTDAEEG